MRRNPRSRLTPKTVLFISHILYIAKNMYIYISEENINFLRDKRLQFIHTVSGNDKLV